MELTIKGPMLKLVGQYKIKGRVLILPIEGAGDCDLSMENVFIMVNFTGEGIERKGKHYIKISDPNVILKTKKYESDLIMEVSFLKKGFFIFNFRLNTRLENLFNGDKRLSKQMNTFLNDNWRDIFEELKPAVIETFGGVFIQITNNVLNNVSYEELYISEAS